ncbi:MAG: hypothetical protein JST68_26625 [Bacteroidetes bacterium]|nr:hypothetical protein [Bacteroidota bacterium]
MKYLFLFFVLCGGRVWGQGSVIDSVLRIYEQRYPEEKVYVQFDKGAYRAGETVWFKAYLFSGAAPSGISKNLYVDFFDGGGRLLKHFVTPVFVSSAKGQFEIPAGVKGSLRVRVYTSWMLNFDAVYMRDLLVVGEGAASGVGSAGGGTTLQFFPEGGQLVDGVNSRLAFLAVDGKGRPVDVAGGIFTAGGVLVDSFFSRHDGMGVVMIMPKAGERYVAKWGGGHVTSLPEVLGAGVGLYVQPLPKRTMVQVTRSADAGDELKTLHLAAYMNKRLVYRSQLNLGVRAAGVAEIPTDSLSTGILQITLFNARLVPVAERIVFVNNHNAVFTTEISVVERGMAARGRNVIEVGAVDTAATNLSVAVVDADVPVGEDGIVSQLLLCDDIKGYVRKPSYYFSGDGVDVRQDLDLVMLTHGWRKFDWVGALRGNLPALRFGRDSDYLAIRGFAAGGNVPAGQQLALVLLAKDSTRQLVTVSVGKDGMFGLHGGVFFDTLRVYYQYIGSKKGELTLRNGFLPALRDAGEGVVVDTQVVRQAAAVVGRQVEWEKAVRAKTLKEVTVTARARKPVDLLDDKYTSGFFKGDRSDVAKQFDLTSDDRANGMSSVFQYLQGMVAGLQVARRNDGLGWALRWRDGAPQLFLDEVPIDAIQMDNVPIQDVAYIKVFRPPFFGSSNGTGGAISVYTKKGGDVKPTPVGEAALSYKTLEGYSAFRKFYSPDYSVPVEGAADTRTTLFWKPYVMTDAHSKKATIEFYNNDISRRFRVIVEGINAAGKLSRVEKIIE